MIHTGEIQEFENSESYMKLHIAMINNVLLSPPKPYREFRIFGRDC